MPINTIPAFIEELRAHDILRPDALEPLQELGRHSDALDGWLADVIGRGWVTEYQVGRLREGCGGDLVRGRYIILERLGRGGMAEVYKARARGGDRIVALKGIRQDRPGEQHQLHRRLTHEIAALQRVGSHPNVAAYEEDFQAEGMEWLVLEYVEGTNLHDLVRRDGLPGVPKACEYVRQAALGLHHMHEQGLVHRDVKPANLIVTPDGVVKILDLGIHLRTRLEPGEARPTRLTESDRGIGTLAYMAPEQLRSAHDVDRRADIYGLGVTLGYLLTGDEPVQGEGAQLEEVRPDLPHRLRAIVQRMTAPDKEERYPTAEVVAEKLAPFAQHGAEKLAGCESVDRLVDLLGVVRAYVPTGNSAYRANSERNQAKIDAIDRAGRRRGRVRLIAETGHSFLYHRSHFYGGIKALLDNGGQFQAILVNKFLAAGHLISAAYRDASALNTEDRLNRDFVHKYEEAIQDYRGLKGVAGDRVQLRIAPCVVPSTILLTDDMIFFEPYLFSDRTRKAQSLFDTFELQLNPRLLRAPGLVQEHFDLLWEQSLPYEVWEGRQDEFRGLLQQLRRLWRG